MKGAMKSGMTGVAYETVIALIILIFVITFDLNLENYRFSESSNMSTVVISMKRGHYI